MRMTEKATKALATFIGGASTWAATYLPPWAGAGIGVLAATFLCFLVKNEKVPTDDRQPVERWGEAGAVEPGSLALGLIVGAAFVYFWLVR